MESSQDKVKEFFWELDKHFPPNHPFIVLHGPADKFREYLENNPADEEEIDDLMFKNIGLKEGLDDLRETITDAIDALKSIDADKDSREEIQVEIETIIKELKAAM